MEPAKVIRFAGLACVLLFATGCTMCSDCDLDSYNAYGGRWQRTNREAGRVGSMFHPAGAQVPYGPSDTSDSSSVLDESERTEEEGESEQEKDEDVRRDGLDFDFGPSGNLQETRLRSPNPL